MPDDLLHDQYNEAALLTARANCRTGGSDAQTAEFEQALQKVGASSWSLAIARVFF